MIRLILNRFGGGSSGSGGIGADGGPKTTTKHEFHGSAGGSGGVGISRSQSDSRQNISDDNYVMEIKNEETYELYRVKDGNEKYYDTDNGKNIREELEGYKPDPATGLWKDRYGKYYRVKRVSR